MSDTSSRSETRVDPSHAPTKPIFGSSVIPENFRGAISVKMIQEIERRCAKLEDVIRRDLRAVERALQSQTQTLDDDMSESHARLANKIGSMSAAVDTMWARINVIESVMPLADSFSQSGVTLAQPSPQPAAAALTVTTGGITPTSVTSATTPISTPQLQGNATAPQSPTSAPPSAPSAQTGKATGALPGGQQKQAQNQSTLPPLSSMPAFHINALGSHKDNRLAPFDGIDGTPLSLWLRRYKDLAMFNSWTDAAKASNLPYYLDGIAREMYEGFTAKAKADFGEAEKELLTCFESPKMRNVARQTLARCRKGARETVVEFANRLRPLVRSTMNGQPDSAFESRLLDEFLDRLTPPYMAREVKLSDPATYGEALFKAQQVEALDMHEAPEVHFAQRQQSCEVKSSIEQQLEELTNQVRELQMQGSLRNQGNPGDYRNQPNNRGRFNQRGGGSNGYRGRDPQAPHYRNPGRQDANYRLGYDRTNDGRPICNHCGQSGHFEYTCLHRLPPSDVPQAQRNVHQVSSINASTKLDESDKLRKQIEALTTQNKRLAQLAHTGFEDPTPECNNVDTSAPPKPKSRAKRGSSSLSLTSTLSIVFLCAISFWPTIAALPNSTQPMLCHTFAGRQVWDLPVPHVCPIASSAMDDIRDEITPVDLFLFKPTKHQFDSMGKFCKKVKTTAKFYTNLLGDAIKETFSELIPMTAAECLRMIKLKECPEGRPQKIGSLYTTNHKLNIEFPTRFLSFWWRSATTTNCFLFESPIRARFNTSTITSPVGEVSHCSFQEGMCALREGSVLVWEPTIDQMAPFTFSRALKAFRRGALIISEDFQFALSFGKKTLIDMPQGIKLRVSDQGLAVYIKTQRQEPDANEPVFIQTLRRTHLPAEPQVKRAKRSETTTAADGVVHSSQLAAQLTAVEAHLTFGVNFAFKHAIGSICDALRQFQNNLRMAVLWNPSLAVRAILNSTFIQARAITAEAVEIWPCIPLDTADISFRAVSEDSGCFEFVPVKVKMPHETYSGFLDPLTMIVAEKSRTAPCVTSRYTVLNLNGVLVEVDQKTGNSTVIPATDIHHMAPSTIELFVPEITPVVFRNLILTNMSDFFPSVHFDTAGFDPFQDLINVVNYPSLHSDTSERLGSLLLNSSFVALMRGSVWCVWQSWIFAVCAYVSSNFLMRFILPAGIRALIHNLDPLALLVTKTKNVVPRATNFATRRFRRNRQPTEMAVSYRQVDLESQEPTDESPLPRSQRASLTTFVPRLIQQHAESPQMPESQQ